MLRIASGSYEGYLFGWSSSEDGQIHQEWGFKTCPGAIRCLAVDERGEHLVCGANDERIHIFDLKSNRSLGELSQHTGAITAGESTYHILEYDFFI